MSTTTANVALATVTPTLTTTFVPAATTCTAHQLTMLENRGYEIWANIPVPVSGSTFSDCYPSQYMTSYLLAAGGVTQPAFNPLVCPAGYTTIGPYTSNYIACCPSGYLLTNPSVSVLADRRAYGGTCYSPLYEATPVIVTAYGSASATATITYQATVTNAHAYAFPIDGFAYGVAEVASLGTTVTTSTVSSSSTSETSSSSSASVASSSTSSAAAAGTSPALSSTGLTTGAKAGVGIGISLGVIAVAILSFFLWRRNAKRDRRSTATSAIGAEMSGNGDGDRFMYADQEQQRKQSASISATTEIASSVPTSAPAPQYELHNSATAHEMNGEYRPYEMQGSEPFLRR